MSREILNTTYRVQPDLMSTAVRLASSCELGTIVHDTTLDRLFVYQSDGWKEIFSNSSGFSGFIDYNDTTGNVALTADTWTDVPNNGQGAFTNTLYKPEGITNLLDANTGYLDFSELSLGSELIVRNDFTVTPQTNNALLEVRYLLGQGAAQYALQFWSERLDNGSGVGYQRVLSFPIYMGDLNTQSGVGKLQVKLSTAGTLNNSGSYISVKIR